MRKREEEKKNRVDDELYSLHLLCLDDDRFTQKDKAFNVFFPQTSR